MSVFMDLNISYSPDKNKLKSLIETAAHLGYSTVAINYVVDLQHNPKYIAKCPRLSELFEKFPIIQGKSRPIRVLTRLTLVISEPHHFRATMQWYKAFDIMAIFPKTEKLFHVACMTYDVDIICVTMTEKNPFFFKRPSVNGAIDRGVHFEISYSAAIRDSSMRRYTIANAINLMECCKGKNVIVTSGTDKGLELRGPYDIANLGLLFGLSEADAKAAVSTNCRTVELHAVTRKTAMGVVWTLKKDEEKEKEKKKGEENEEEQEGEKREEEKEQDEGKKEQKEQKKGKRDEEKEEENPPEPKRAKMEESYIPLE